MKILFHNYSNPLSTEPLYLHNAFVKSGVNSTLWSNKAVSTYDMFDTHKPDIFVTHFQVFSYDIMNYLKNNRGCEVVMNVTGATQAQVDSIEQAFAEANIKSPFIFTNDFSVKVKAKKLNLIKLAPAADIFSLDYGPFKNVGIPEAIISNKFSENLDNYIANKEVFHLLYVTDKDLDSHFDVRVNALNLQQLYKLYPKIVLVGDNDICCSQIFLDMNMSCKKVEVKSTDQDGFNKMLSDMFTDSSGEDLQLEIKNQIKSKHTPFDRAWRFMKYLSNNDAMNKIMKIKNDLPQLLKDV